MLGISALFISGKYQEIYPPELRDYVYITKDAISKDMILKMEMSILKVLEYDLLIVSPLEFFNRLYFISAGNVKDFETEKYTNLYYLAMYILQITLIDYDMLKFSSSIIACSVLLITRKFLNCVPHWPKKMMSAQGFSNISAINNCSQSLINLLKSKKEKMNSGIYRKFSSSKYKNISSFFDGRSHHKKI